MRHLIAQFALLFSVSILKGDETFKKGPRCPLYDSFQDEGPILINITVDPLVSIWEGSQLTNIFVDGISLLSYDLNMDILNLKLNWEVNIPHLTGKANYAIEGYLDGRPLREETLPSGNLTGVGFGNFSVSNFHAQINSTFYIDIKGGIRFTKLELIKLSFSAVDIDLGQDFVIDGDPVDWKDWSENFKSNFDVDFKNYHVEISDKFCNATNHFLKERGFNFRDLIELYEYLVGDRECVALTTTISTTPLTTTTTSTTTQATTTEDPHGCNESPEYRAIDCHNYYSCIDFTYKRYFTCPVEDGLAFNPELGMCDRMKNVEGCINCGIAYRPDYENCKNYFFCPDICREGLCELRSCPDDLLYSIDFYEDGSGVQQCTLPEKAVCAEK